MSTILQKVSSLGHHLPKVAIPVAKYLPYLLIDNRIIVSGQISKDDNDALMIGKLGQDYSIEHGIQAAQRSALFIIAIIDEVCKGDISKVQQIVKLGGFVNSTSDFTDHPKVINGASNLMVDVFGEKVGMHARSAVGVSSLPLGVAVEIEAEILLK